MANPESPASSDIEIATRPQKRSLTIAGHRTSISLEAAFWDALRDFANRDGRTIADLVAEIDGRRRTSGLSGAIRVYVLQRALRETLPDRTTS